MASAIGTEMQDLSSDYVEKCEYRQTTQMGDQITKIARFIKAEDAGKLTSNERAECQVLVANLDMYHLTVKQAGLSSPEALTLSEKIMKDFRDFRDRHRAISISGLTMGLA